MKIVCENVSSSNQFKFKIKIIKKINELSRASINHAKNLESLENSCIENEYDNKNK